MRMNQSAEGPERHSPIPTRPSSSSNDIDLGSSAGLRRPPRRHEALSLLSGLLGHSLEFWVCRMRAPWHNFAKCSASVRADGWTQIHCSTEPDYRPVCLVLPRFPHCCYLLAEWAGELLGEGGIKWPQAKGKLAEEITSIRGREWNAQYKVICSWGKWKGRQTVSNHHEAISDVWKSEQLTSLWL